MRTTEIDLDVHRLIEGARRSFEETDNDILRRLLEIEGRAQAEAGPRAISAAPVRTVETAIQIGHRTTGLWSVRIGSERYLARNLREAYVTAIAKLADRADGLLERLAKEGGGRRRIVAREPTALYPRSPHLAEPHRNNWHRLGEWCVDLNLSRDQAAKRIRRASALAGLRYGHAIAVTDGTEPL